MVVFTFGRGLLAGCIGRGLVGIGIGGGCHFDVVGDGVLLLGGAIIVLDLLLPAQHLPEGNHLERVPYISTRGGCFVATADVKRR